MPAVCPWYARRLNDVDDKRPSDARSNLCSQLAKRGESNWILTKHPQNRVDPFEPSVMFKHRIPQRVTLPCRVKYGISDNVVRATGLA